jgi:hypothetical protein
MNKISIKQVIGLGYKISHKVPDIYKPTSKLVYFPEQMYLSTILGRCSYLTTKSNFKIIFKCVHEQIDLADSAVAKHTASDTCYECLQETSRPD